MKTALLALMALVAISCSNTPSIPIGPTPPVVPITPNGPQLHATGFKKMQSGAGLASGSPFINADQAGELPYKFSWNAAGFSLPVRNQGACGSCWAFASTQTLDGAMLIFKDEVLTLSEQELVGQDSDYGGCSGGDFAGAYMVKNGMVKDSDCPYQADNSSCKSGLKPAALPVSWANVGGAGRSPTVAELKYAIIEFGYVAVDVAADGSWDSYSGGVKSSCGATGINHMVTLTGWDDTQGAKGVWEMKNSWGADWGQQGYALMPYGCDSIATDAAYIVVEK